MADGSSTGWDWIAMRVPEPKKETLAKRWLENAGFHVELPMEIREYRQRRGKRERFTVERPALRGYIFLALPAVGMEARDIKGFSDGARDIVPYLGWPVGYKGQPIVIKSGWLETIPTDLLDPDGVRNPRYEPKAGDKVELTEAAGLYSGYRGMIDSVTMKEARLLITALHSVMRVTVSVDAIRRAA